MSNKRKWEISKYPQLEFSYSGSSFFVIGDNEGIANI